MAWVQCNVTHTHIEKSSRLQAWSLSVLNLKQMCSRVQLVRKKSELMLANKAKKPVYDRPISSPSSYFKTPCKFKELQLQVTIFFNHRNISANSVTFGCNNHNKPLQDPGGTDYVCVVCVVCVMNIRALLMNEVLNDTCFVSESTMNIKSMTPNITIQGGSVKKTN